ncbi:JAB domain-containing protein [Bordetella bronchialis]|uniref:JAB domain-containing protein n=1 Tax=Bordetella bronchialis TaxID=463025 RepID=UPI003D003FCD
MQYSLAFNATSHPKGTLLVQDDGGTVRPAGHDTILAAARDVILNTRRRGESMTSPEKVRDFLRLRLHPGLQHEVVGVLYLTSENELIAYDEPFRGTLGQAPLYPREIVKAALAYNAAAIIMAHNHPSGNPEPSRADVTATGEVKAALQLVGVTLLDHLVVAGNAITSLAERHLMP